MNIKSLFENKYLLISFLTFCLMIGVWYFYQQTPWGLAARYQHSGLKGIEWIIKHSDEFSPRDTVAYLLIIYKVIDDESMARKIYQVIEQNRAKIKPTNTSIDPKIKLLNWNNDIAPVAEEIARLKCTGKPMTVEIQALKETLLKHKEEVFPNTISDADRYIADYDLQEIGIETDGLYTRPRIDQRIITIGEKGQLSRSDREWLYGLTHSVIIPTGYFNTYIDQKSYSEQVRLFKNVIQTKNLSLSYDSTVDIIAQVIVSLKLLKQGDDTLTNRVKKQLMDVQNHDGSWGSESVAKSQKIHETTMSILALLHFAPQFKLDKVFCY